MTCNKQSASAPSRSGLLLAVAALCAAGCVARARIRAEPVHVSAAPPHRVAERLDCPPGYIFVEGHFHWDGHGWVWIDSRCVHKPGYVWIAPAYVSVGGGVKYREGYWKPGPEAHEGKPVHEGEPVP